MVMIVQLRKEGKTIRQISIVLMMMLLIFFLAAPASAVTNPKCFSMYTAYVKVIDPPVVTQTKEALVLTYRMPVVPVVTFRMYVTSTRTITKWHMQRNRITYTWCTVNKRCEKGPSVLEIGSSGTTTSAWMPISYRTTRT